MSPPKMSKRGAFLGFEKSRIPDMPSLASLTISPLGMSLSKIAEIIGL